MPRRCPRRAIQLILAFVVLLALTNIRPSSVGTYLRGESFQQPSILTLDTNRPRVCPYIDLDYPKGRFRCRPPVDDAAHIRVMPDPRAAGVVYFLGDSLMGQIFVEYICRLHFAVGTQLERLPAVENTLQNMSPKSRRIRCFSASFTMLRSSTSLRACYVDASMVYRTPVAELLETLPATKGAVLLLNGGIHWRLDEDADPQKRAGASELKRVRAINASRVRELIDGGVRLFWVETMAQHFATPTGLFGGWYDGRGQGGARCVPISDTRPVERLNSMVNDVLREKGIPIVAALADSIRADPEQHLAQKTAHLAGGKRGGTDCTHWCEPSASPLGMVVDRFIQQVRISTRR